ncbi:MAG: gamma-glutamyl-gamma-aminobutyrate hydrolase family protein [Candidatus Bipolaricaulota bacterium]
MPERPTIAVSCSFDEDTEVFRIHRGYVDALVENGALPFIVPHSGDEQLSPKEILAQVDGVLFSGGTDFDPIFFDEEPRYELASIVPGRDRLEIALLQEAVEAGMPILGICRGVQTINIAAGGSVYQDIEAQIEDPLRHHQDAPRWYPTHKIEVRPDSLLRAILGRDRLGVNSFHHQSAREIARGFRISATSRDGVIEAIEAENGAFQLGVQWHPERMWEKYPVHGRLFSRLVEASRNWKD